jgi:phage/plasmid-associated DNA primase
MCFAEVPEDELRVRVQAYDGAPCGPPDKARPLKLSSSQVKGVITEARAIVAAPHFFDQAAAGINTLSGLICFDKVGGRRIEPHSPSHRLRHVLPARIEGEPVARPPPGSLLHDLLERCFRGDPEAEAKIALVGELAGAAAAGLAHRLHSPRAVVLLGETGANGKSQVLDLLKGLLPPDAVASITPAQMSQDQFRAQLAGKLLNASDELGNAAIGSEVFKAVVTGETVMGKIVYRPPFDFRPLALHVFATNRLPPFQDGMDQGVRRRLTVLTFERTIPPAERIIGIGKRVAKEEAELLLGFAIAGAERLLKRGDFTGTHSGHQALARWALVADPVHAFIEDDAVLVSGRREDSVSSRDAYQSFRKRAETEGLPPSRLPTHTQFTGRVKETAPAGLDVRRHGKSGTMFVGMRLRHQSSHENSPRK